MKRSGEEGVRRGEGGRGSEEEWGGGSEEKGRRERK